MLHRNLYQPLICWVAALAAVGAATTGAHAHPHVFAEAKLEVTVKDDGTIDRLRHVWRFDELFSTTVLLEFDADSSGELDEAELTTVRNVVTSSIADFNYFQSVTAGGEEIGLQPVDDMRAMIQDGQLILFFTTQPAQPVSLESGPHIAVYDPTFYTAIEFFDASAMEIINAPSGCSHEMVIPDPDEALAQNQQTLTEAFFNEPGGNDLSKILATRMEIACVQR